MHPEMSEAGSVDQEIFRMKRIKASCWGAKPPEKVPYTLAWFSRASRAPHNSSRSLCDNVGRSGFPRGHSRTVHAQNKPLHCILVGHTSTAWNYGTVQGLGDLYDTWHVRRSGNSSVRKLHF